MGSKPPNQKLDLAVAMPRALGHRHNGSKASAIGTTESRHPSPDLVLKLVQAQRVASWCSDPPVYETGRQLKVARSSGHCNTLDA